MNVVKIQQAGMQSTVGRDCRERLPSSACDPSCVDELAPFKRGKCFDGFSYLLLGEPQLVEAT